MKRVYFLKTNKKKTVQVPHVKNMRLLCLLQMLFFQKSLLYNDVNLWGTIIQDRVKNFFLSYM